MVNVSGRSLTLGVMGAIAASLLWGVAVPLLPMSLNPIAEAQAQGILKKGDRGEAVERLQRQLQQVGVFNGPITGFYGDQTETAVRQFQRSRGLNPDGVAGQRTLNLLAEVIAARSRQPQFQTFGEGSQGDRVAQLQLRLQLLDYLTNAPTRNFDRATKAALIQFQRDRGINADGVVGQQTWTVIHSAISTAQIRNMQERLRVAGFYRGSINGQLDAATQQAIESARRIYRVSAAAVLRGSY
ncbi:peptidoglycan-binding domain-containing protein [Spirulina sp. CCNP1310]|uniref:peptidoglycan-binding domain-containing protein n=1 Tax=Spirulina sp. CCNP1310 TaxID=3110249 RepID=UPI002B1FDBB7|nr:peptidoglycan-binding domain-containing protein [Spirulina sp. CCNP1310]MEA5420284.1 peptidoglycan-binding domain-containing protein [Spirulina sp. CCNP1310]